MRRIKVNTQVTFMISVLEMIGFIFMITALLIFKSTSLPLIINIEIMYMIVLPLAYLNNTSYNKSRIIEHGWENVLKNTFGLSPNLPSPDGCEINKMNENPTSNRVRKVRVPVNQYKRSRIHPQTTSHDVKKHSSVSFPSTLKVSTTNNFLNCDMEQKNNRREIMMRPEKLKRARPVNKTSKNLFATETRGFVEGENELGCTAKRIRKSNCSKNGDLSITDLEQESEVLFSCR